MYKLYNWYCFILCPCRACCVCVTVLGMQSGLITVWCNKQSGREGQQAWSKGGKEGMEHDGWMKEPSLHWINVTQDYSVMTGGGTLTLSYTHSVFHREGIEPASFRKAPSIAPGNSNLLLPFVLLSLHPSCIHVFPPLKVGDSWIWFSDHQSHTFFNHFDIISFDK